MAEELAIEPTESIELDDPEIENREIEDAEIDADGSFDDSESSIETWRLTFVDAGGQTLKSRSRNRKKGMPSICICD